MKNLLAVMFLLLSACASTAKITKVSATGMKVKVVKQDPSSTLCSEIGPVEAKDGDGCGLLGSQGSYAGAYNNLRNMAGEMGANLVRMDSQVPPHQIQGCYVNEFVIRGTAYDCKVP